MRKIADNINADLYEALEELMEAVDLDPLAPEMIEAIAKAKGEL